MEEKLSCQTMQINFLYQKHSMLYGYLFLNLSVLIFGEYLRDEVLNFYIVGKKESSLLSPFDN